MEKISHMEYWPEMEVLEESTVMDQVLEAMEAYDYNAYTAQDVIRALNKENRGPEEFKALLSPAAEPFLEERARLATCLLYTSRWNYDRYGRCSGRPGNGGKKLS